MPSKTRRPVFRPICTQLEDRWTPAITLGLTGGAVPEFRPSGATAGTLTATDTVPGTHTYTFALVAGAGSDDNGSFAVSGNKLVTAAALDSTRVPYQVRVRATDEAGQTGERVFTVTAADDPDVLQDGTTLYVVGTAGNDTFVYQVTPTPAGNVYVLERNGGRSGPRGGAW